MGQENIERTIRKEKRFINQNLFTFLVFLIISSIFWFFNALNKEAVTTVSYPVYYINFPENKILLEDLPDHLQVKVEAPGYVLLKYKILPQMIPLEFNVKELSFKKMKDKKNSYKLYILTDQLKDEIQLQLGHNIEIKDILPDSLIFRFAEVVSKKVPVRPNVKLEIDKPFMLKDMVFAEPDSINISGPRSIIDTIRYVSTQRQVIKHLKDSPQKNIALEVIKNVAFSRKYIMVKFPVEQFTQANVSVPLEIVNLPKNVELKVFPKNISVSCMVALSDFEKLNESLFQACVDFNSIDKFGNKLKVKLEVCPDFVKSIKYSPKNVDYIIEK